MINQHSERTFSRTTELELIRRRFTDQSTIGDLYFEGARECYILEPPKRGLKPCCIPVGRYEIRLTHSEKFGVLMPILCDVPGRQGIRIHPGNHPKDTLGCLCPGSGAPGFDFVADSTVTYEALLEKLKRAAGPVWMTVREG
jgi:hypothetical protein